MADQIDRDFLIEVFRYFASIDCHSDLFWNIWEKQPLMVYVMCNDQFFWGSADVEEITPENFPELQRAVTDCVAVAPDDPCNKLEGLMLFCSRMRKERPQGASYPRDRRLWPLFDEAGPEKKIGLGNPYGPGDYPKQS